MKKIIIIIAIILVGMFAALAYVVIFKKPTTTGPDTTNTNYSIKPLPSPEIPQGTLITLSTKEGNVTVNNFFKSAVRIIETAVYLKDNSNYSIIYYSDKNQFMIALYASDSSQANNFRKQAENNLLNILGISQTNACKLSVDVEIPATYNQSLSNQNYHLSFCSDGASIPGFNGNPDTSPNSIR
jgi:hypothetical protein